MQILESVVLEPAPMAGLRQIELSVVDARGAASDTFVVNVNLNATGAEIGTPGDDVLRRPARWSTTRSPVLTATTSCSATPATTFWTVARATTSWMAARQRPADRRPLARTSMVYTSPAERGDLIFGFNAGEGDRLDFSDLFDGGADPNDIDPFVRFDAAGNDVQVNVDQDGAGRCHRPSSPLPPSWIRSASPMPRMRSTTARSWCDGQYPTCAPKGKTSHLS